VGLIGFPNAGKSTLICAISKVKSKIAAILLPPGAYPGIVKDEDNEDDNFVVADLPA